MYLLLLFIKHISMHIAQVKPNSDPSLVDLVHNRTLIKIPAADGLSQGS